jgi:two-component sensor histidine kinase
VPGEDLALPVKRKVIAVLGDQDMGESRLRKAMTLALVIHELATNSLRYGALSSATGTLDVSCAPHDSEVAVVWTERGGPAVVAPTGSGGFGSRLVQRGMAAQLGGSISAERYEDGVVVSLV